MRGYGTWIFVAILVAVGYYLFAVNPTLYEIHKFGPHTYRKNRLDGNWEVKKGNTWEVMKRPPAKIDPATRLGEVGIKGFQSD